MFRMRRYRAFLLVAALSAATLYYLVNVRHATLSDVDRLRHFGFGTTPSKEQSIPDHYVPIPPEHQPDPPPALFEPPTLDPEIELPPVPTKAPNKVAPVLDDDDEDNVVAHTTTSTTTAAEEAETTTGEELLPKKHIKEDGLKEIHESQWELDKVPDDANRAHWKPQKEHNPVPKEKLIRLPTGTPKSLPIVQHEFSPETDGQKADRLRKVIAIREAFKRAWQGYVKFAMPHDELWPVTKSYGDSFMGWGATLVDSLDSLWIMDFKDEFEMAVNQTAKIDFTTSHKKEIPLFETVIRILGGLISAYDLSNEQYPILLTKATELAEILMGAFDTPNRMPDMYYRWAPSYASQQHRAGTKVVVAELGSVSMEFTRLAQITKETKYYDAIARVQNALEKWQMETEMPGLWPLVLDASGCKKTDKVKVQADNAENSEKPILIDSDQISEDELKHGLTPADPSAKDVYGARVPVKRQADDLSAESEPDSKIKGTTSGQDRSLTSPKSNTALDDDPEDPYCKPQGLNYEPYANTHKYAIAAQADSVYEYMPKMHRLLGGLSSQYESMYKNAAKAIREKILYRPMIEDESRKILFPAVYRIDMSKRVKENRIKTVWEATHLGCFAGGMMGLAAKTFGISSDMELAKQLTDGCVWAYESTQTKIMPEKFTVVHCEDPISCPWDDTKWHKALDSRQKERMDAVDAWNKEQKVLFGAIGMNVAKDKQTGDGLVPPKKVEAAAVPTKPQPTVKKGGIKKETFGKEPSIVKRDPPVDEENPTKTFNQLYDEDETPLEQFGFVPKVALAHDRYVKARIQEERLPPGYTKIYDRSYILRPEAIESVFIMWRITGEDSWREKGWHMFQAIQEATHTEAGNAELDDVTSILGEKRDLMQSFWLGETLKYCYLLFSEPTLVSLDDYVLNTEAHPFKVPKPL